MAALVATMVAQLILPLGAIGHQTAYALLSLGAMVIAASGVVIHSPAHRLGWMLLIAGFTGLVVGDAAWSVERLALDLHTHPVPSDAVHLAGYGLVVVGLISIIRTHRHLAHRGSLLDMAIVATGSTMLIGALLVLPLLADSSASSLSKAAATAYLLADVLLLTGASQLWATPGIRCRSYVLLLLALLAIMVPDVVSMGIALRTDYVLPSSLIELVRVLGYVLFAAAACHPSMRTLSLADNYPQMSIASRRHLTLLAGGLLMPAMALLLQETSTKISGIPVIGICAVVLWLLTLLRISNLLGLIDTQAARLAALANSDLVTGAPDRRAWDYALSEACRESVETDTPLCVALLELDRFKKFNDEFGHQAGDQLLREAVSAWIGVVKGEGVLTRYGGGAFAILLPRMHLAEAVDTLLNLRDVTPSGQTFSAGVSVWRQDTEPTLALADADRGLDLAKRAGRNRVRAYPVTEVAAGRPFPTPRIVVQPIVDLCTGEVVGYEALSRFGDRAPEAIFQVAIDNGYGDVLEGTAIAAALAVPNRPDILLHVNASAEAMQSERFWALVPEDLRGVVVEISEHYEEGSTLSLPNAVDTFRSRGALIGLDDLGQGSQELLRLATVRPDVLKIDRSLVAGCASDPGRQAVVRGGVEMIRSLGGQICAEGAEDVRDLEAVFSLGVRYAQCFLLGRPSTNWGPRWVKLPFPHQALSPPVTVGRVLFEPRHLGNSDLDAQL